MRLLAADTATSSCSVAVSENDVIRGAFTVNLPRTHAKSLMPVIDDVLSACGLCLAEIDAFAVTTGPGSFTGVRICISTLKGLAAATGKPIFGVSTLEALAFQFAGASILICPLIDARKGEVYTARYRWKNGRFAVDMPPDVQSPDTALNGINESCLFVGNGALLYQDSIRKQIGSRAFFAAGDQHFITAGRVAHMGYQKILKNRTNGAESIFPHYIRPSDAEQNMLKKTKEIPVLVDIPSST